MSMTEILYLLGSLLVSTGVILIARVLYAKLAPTMLMLSLQRPTTPQWASPCSGTLVALLR